MSFKISRQQADATYEALYPHANYIVRLRNRLRAVGVDERDPVYLAAVDADEAVRKLRLELHALRCAKDGGRPLTG